MQRKDAHLVRQTIDRIALRDSEFSFTRAVTVRGRGGLSQPGNSMG